MNRLPVRRGLTLFIATLGLAIVTAGLFGAVHRYLDVFSHLMWHGAGVTFGGLLALAWPRRAILILLSVALMTLAVPAAISLAFQRDVGPEAPSGGLKILSFNTWHSNREHERIADLIRSETPDVAVLLEFGPDKQHVLDELLPLYPFQTGCVHEWYCGVALISRRPFLSSGFEQRGRTRGPPRAWATFESTVAGKPWTIIGVHLMRPIDSPRRHGSEFLRLAEQVRAAPGPVVLIGDFNAVGWAASVTHFEAASKTRRVDRLLPSWPAGRRGPPQLPIDHAFVTRDIDGAEVWLGPQAGSDHLPLIGVFKLGKVGQ